MSDADMVILGRLDELRRHGLLSFIQLWKMKYPEHGGQHVDFIYANIILGFSFAITELL